MSAERPDVPDAPDVPEAPHGVSQRQGALGSSRGGAGASQAGPVLQPHKEPEGEKASDATARSPATEVSDRARATRSEGAHGGSGPTQAHRRTQRP